MAKPNYSFEKRQRELAKKKKQEEKDARKREAKQAANAAATDAAEAAPGPMEPDASTPSPAAGPRTHLRK